MTGSDHTPATPAALKTLNLTKKFGRHKVLRGLNLTVREGEVYGFLGRNGAGKTTAIRICMGILRATAGQIEIFGDVVARPTVGHKRQIGYVSQESHFYPWMSCEKLGRFVGSFYPDWDPEEFSRLLAVLDLPPKRRASQLSGGMRAKLGLALALAHRPRLLLLDEPTAGLDPVARREFVELIRLQARDGKHTTLFSSHIVEEVERVADRIGILDSGTLAFEGDLETLRASVRRMDIMPLPTAAVAPAPVSTPPVSDPPTDPWLRQGFEVLSDSEEHGVRTVVLRASPETWTRATLPPGEVSRMSLEDIFLAVTVGKFFKS